MTTRKQKTGNNIPDSPASTLKNKPLEEGINKEKIRETLLKDKWVKQVAKLLKESPKNISVVVELLEDSNSDVRWNAASALKHAVGNGTDITVAIPALANALGDRVLGVRRSAAEALGDTVENGLEITIAIPALVKAVEDEDPFVRRSVAWALGYATHKGEDISVAIPALVKALGDRIWSVQGSAAYALGNAASKDHKTRVAITKAIMDFMNSNDFMVEAEKNSERFIQSINAIDQFSRRIDELEGKEA